MHACGARRSVRFVKPASKQKKIKIIAVHQFSSSLSICLHTYKYILTSPGLLSYYPARWLTRVCSNPSLILALTACKGHEIIYLCIVHSYGTCMPFPSATIDRTSCLSRWRSAMSDINAVHICCTRVVNQLTALHLDGNDHHDYKINLHVF